MIDHSFIVPLYNEEINIRGTVETIISSSASILDNYEIIIVNDFSTDNSMSVCRDLEGQYPFIKVISNSKNLGFAESFKIGLDRSIGNFVQYIPSDNVICTQSLTKLLEHRFPGELTLQYCLNPKERAWSRFLVSKLYGQILNFLNKTQINYFNGLHIYPGDFLRGLNIIEKSFSFQAEIVVAAIARNISYHQVGTTCAFKDETSSALRISNITGVLFFLLKQIFTTCFLRRLT